MFFNPECHNIDMVQDLDGNWRVAIRERVEFSGSSDIIALELPDNISDVIARRRYMDVLKFKK